MQGEKGGVWSGLTAISDQKQLNKIIIVSICRHDAENMLKDKSCEGRLFEEGSGFPLGYLFDPCGLNTTRLNVIILVSGDLAH